MSGAEYRQALGELRLAMGPFAQWLGYHPVTGRTWGKVGPPRPIEKWVRYLQAERLSPREVDAIIKGEH